MRPLSRREWVAVLAAVVFVLYAMFGQIIVNTFKRSAANIGGSPQANIETSAREFGGGVEVRDVVVGTGALVTPPMNVKVNYVLRLADSTVIQDSKLVNSGEPFSFTYGAGELIPGWEMGIEGMRVGGKRVITIPPHLGYGSQPVGPIPANSTLIFEIEIVSAENSL